MFDVNNYVFKGKHARIVTDLTQELDSETKFALFVRNIDVLIIAPIIGFLYGRMAEKDNSATVSVDNVKKINYQQLTGEADKLQYNYQLIMLLHDKDKIDIEERLNRAFKYNNGTPEKDECDAIFEKYILGGIEVLGEKILENNKPITVDDYIENMYYFVEDYKKRTSTLLSTEEIIEQFL